MRLSKVKAPDFIEVANKDRKVRNLRRMMKRGIYNINIEILLNEIQSLHTTRLLRTLKTNKLLSRFSKRFTESALQNQAYRSRVVEIQMQFFRISAKLDRHLKAIRSRLMTNYANSFNTYSNAETRKSALDTILAKPLDLYSRLESAINYTNIVIKDLDQASWTLKSIEEAIKSTSEDRHRSI